MVARARLVRKSPDWRRGVAAAFASAFISLAIATPSHAAWLKAETDRFVVYSDGRESELTAFVTKLTTFDAMLREIHTQAGATPTTGKFIVYLVSGSGQLRRLWPGVSPSIRGYYRADTTGAYAVAVRSDNGGWLGADDVLFHEYMHRFMLETFPAAYPGWLVEAYAEYFATTEIRPDHVEIGNYSQERAYSLRAETWLPWSEVLGKSVAELRPAQRSVFYAQAWMLLHYMMADRDRRVQLNTAITKIGAGKNPVEAFQEATGMDEEQLNKALRAYINAKIALRRGPNPLKAPPAIVVTPLAPSADSLLLEAQRLEDGVAEAARGAFLEDLRARCAKYPGDRLAELTLARLEAAYGDAGVADVIIKRWLEKEPESADVLRLAADAEISAAARNPADRDKHLRAARPFLGKAYQKDPDDFRLLYSYAYARSIEPGYPTENELKALLRAHELAPSVEAIAIQAGAALLRRGQRDRALRILQPVANDPHGGESASYAQALINGTPAGMKAAPDVKLSAP